MIVTVIVLWFMPRWTQSIITRLGATQVSEPEVKFIFFILFFLGGLATTAKSEAVLPAYLLGLVVAGVFLRDKTLVRRMRSIAFAVFTPFYFIKAGLYVSLPALWAGLLVISVFLGLKMVTKIVGVFPLARLNYTEDEGSELHHTAYGHGSDIWDHFLLVWPAKRNHRPESIHHSCQCGHLERVCADADCAKIFPTDGRNDACLGARVPTAAWDTLS